MRASLGYDVRTWLWTGAELSYNRLTTGIETYNCIQDPGSSTHGTCYPAAGVDEALALWLTGRSSWPARVSPYVVVGAGVGQLRLEVDEPFEGVPGIEDVTSVRPVARGGIGLAVRLGTYRLSLESSLNVSFGRGGGAHHFPVVVSIEK